MRLILAWFCMLVGFNCVAQSVSQQPTALPVGLCALLDKASEHNGKEVVVSGRYMNSFHGTVMKAAGCSHEVVNLRNAAGFKAKKQDVDELGRILAEGHYVNAVLRGIFRVAGKEQCFGQACAPYEIEVLEIVSVAQEISGNRRRYDRACDGFPASRVGPCGRSAEAAVNRCCAANRKPSFGAACCFSGSIQHPRRDGRKSAVLCIHPGNYTIDGLVTELRR